MSKCYGLKIITRPNQNSKQSLNKNPKNNYISYKSLESYKIDIILV